MAAEERNGKIAIGKQAGSFFHHNQLTDTQFQKFGSLVYRKTGIYLKPEKKELLKARLGKRLRACGIDSFKKYYDYVINDQSGKELIHLIDSISTNFTSFFREQSHFDYLTETILPTFMQEGRGGGKDILFWSAACSSGEEPYTLAMVVEDFFEHHPGRRYKIVATDISTKVLAHAQRGVYTDDQIGKVPKPFLKKFLQKGVGRSAGYVKIKKHLRQMITFDRLNLMEKFPWQEEMDVIFCRNVMIYFNRETQQELIKKFYGTLAPGGYLLIGHSESMSSLDHDFKQVDATVYRK